jgi:hypothetical protein
MLGTLEEAKEAGASIVSINPLPEAGLLRFKNPQRPSGVVGRGTALCDQFLQIRVNGDLALFQALNRDEFFPPTWSRSARPRSANQRMFAFVVMLISTSLCPLARPVDGLEVNGRHLASWPALAPDVTEMGLPRPARRRVAG